MLKCIQPTGLPEFDSSIGDGSSIDSTDSGESKVDAIGAVELCDLSVVGLTQAKPNLGSKPRGEMGKELLASAADYIRVYLLNSLVDGSGTGAVAIDNKIEQAMDLVKSHLMFAVREEVELLKEQIRELIERNQQLEYENAFLRSCASPETLAKLAANKP